MVLEFHPEALLFGLGPILLLLSILYIRRILQKESSLALVKQIFWTMMLLVFVIMFFIYFLDFLQLAFDEALFYNLDYALEESLVIIAATLWLCISLIVLKILVILPSKKIKIPRIRIEV